MSLDDVSIAIDAAISAAMDGAENDPNRARKMITIEQSSFNLLVDPIRKKFADAIAQTRIIEARQKQALIDELIAMGDDMPRGKQAEQWALDRGMTRNRGRTLVQEARMQADWADYYRRVDMLKDALRSMSDLPETEFSNDPEVRGKLYDLADRYGVTDHVAHTQVVIEKHRRAGETGTEVQKQDAQERARRIGRTS